jgi:hypothetical protein
MNMLKTKSWTALIAIGMMTCGAAVAQSKPTDKNAGGDPQIAAAMKEVSAARIRATVEKLVSFHNRNTLSAADARSVAQGRGIGAAREWIRAEFERYSKACGGCLQVRMDSFTAPPAERVKQPTEVVDVVATLPGADPANASRIVVVTGHYDSRSSDTFDVTGFAPGANDDASGTAVSLECARVLSQHKFPATIIFLAVAGEEQGLLGSAHFAQEARAKGLDIEAVLNNDIVGGNRTPGDKQQQPTWVRVFSEGIPSWASEKEVRMIRAQGEESDSPSRELARYIYEVGRQYASDFVPRGAAPARAAHQAPAFEAKLVFRPDRYLRGGDQTPFNQQGYAAVRFSEYREDFNHQHQTPRMQSGIEYGDLPKFVDFDYVANVTRLNAATLGSLASAPAAPVHVRLETTKLENNSTLKWDPSPGGLAAKYEVVWRPTTAAEWENVEPVGNVTEATLPRSKDNVIFAVRAVDKAGHRSLPVVPEPER